MARRIGDPELLGRTLNNFSIAVWGRPGAAELRLAAADESLALAGRGLPRRTEFVAHLHRAALRLHLNDLAGFEADHDRGAAAGGLAERAGGAPARAVAGGRPRLAARERRAGGGADDRGVRAVPEGHPARAARLRRAPVHAAPGRPPPGRRDPAARRDRRRGQPAPAGDGGARGGRVGRPAGGAAAARPLGPHAGAGLGQRRRALPAGGVRAVAGRRAGVGRRRGVAAAVPRAAGGARDAVPRPGRLRRAARPDRRAPRRPRRCPRVVAVRAGAGRCWSVRRTRSRWPTRSSPGSPPPASRSPTSRVGRMPRCRREYRAAAGTDHHTAALARRALSGWWRSRRRRR